MIYLDHHATTPVHPEVVAAMLPYLTESYANPASTLHAAGRAAAEATESARADVAASLGARSSEIVFTSGATESNNLALRGVMAASRRAGSRRDVLIVGATEHKSVLEPAASLAGGGCEVRTIGVDRHGRIDLDALADQLDDRTALVSVQLANGEIGTLQPVAAIAEMAHRRGGLLHCDAVQAPGRLPLVAADLGADLLSLSAHKMYGPKGVGALYVRRGIRLEPQMSGGGQEKGRRSGTTNVPGVVGFGVAARIATRDLDREAGRLAALRDRLWRALSERVDDIEMNGHPTERLPNNLHVTFRDVEAESLILTLRDVAVSTGSACSSSTAESSHVLRAIGLGREAFASLRFGLGRDNDVVEIEEVAGRIADAVPRLRAVATADSGRRRHR